MALVSGTRLGPYEILSLLGVGGMGEVYRVRDTRLDRTVAIKILSQLSTNPAQKQRFEREARTISSLNHPNICTLHDIGHQDGIDYIVMECVEGETLAKRLEKGPLPIDQVLKIGAQIADALDKAHHAGIIHRDLKPGNIMLTPSGAKLLDFGLAKPASALTDMATMTATKVETPVTERGTIVGTFQYMSPEQIEGRDLDGRSDIFSLGAVLYEMVTGHHAFEGKSRLSVASAILEKEPAPITTIKPLAPTALDHAIRTCLAKDPNERWQTARDLSHELKWITQSSSQAGAPAVTGRGSRIMPERIAWTTAVVLLCAALGVAFLKRGAPDRTVVRSAILLPPDRQFTSSLQAAAGAAISPNGKQVVSPVMDSQGNISLWLRDLNEAGEGRILPGTENGGLPFWSPDGGSIAFFALGKLKRIDIGTNLVQFLCDVNQSRGGTWNATGIILFAPINSGLYQIPASGGAPKQATELNNSRKEQSHSSPTFLADGKHFLFFVSDPEQPELQGIYVGSIDSKEYHLVVKTLLGPAFETGGTIVYMRDGVVVAQRFDERELVVSGDPVALPDHVGFNPIIGSAWFSVSAADNMVYYPVPPGGLFALSWYDRVGRRGETIDTGYISNVTLSTDGTHAVASIFSPDSLNSDIWTYDLSRGTKTRLPPGPGKLPSLFGNILAWQHDGQSVLFPSGDTGGLPHIYRTKSDGSGGFETVLNSDGVSEYPNSVCRNGQYLAYTRVSEKSPASIWVLPLTGDERSFALVQSKIGNYSAVFSPDCKWIAYASGIPGAGSEVYLTHFPDAAHRYQVSTQGGYSPHWRADGKELFYYSQSPYRIMAVDVSDWAQEVSLGTPRTLFAVGIPSRYFSFDVTPDGQRFLISTANPQPGPVPLTLVTNWQAELKKK